MKLVTTLLLLVPVLLMSKQSYSADSCISKYTKYDICSEARELSNEIAKELPIISKDISWESVASIKSTIIANIRLHYNRDRLISIYKKAGLPISLAKESMTKSANSICNTKEVNTFIGLGGKIQYIYKFIDGEQFLTIDVEKCD